MEIVSRYIRDNCKEGGEQDLSKQLSKHQILGRKKLSKRVAKGKLRISTSDKGKRVVVMPLEMYEKVTERHTTKDKIVDWNHLRDSQ